MSRRDGLSVAPLGDISNDRINDFIVGAAGAKDGAVVKGAAYAYAYIPTAVEVGEGARSLLRSAPNPFVGATVVSFEAPLGGVVALRVHDVAGRLVRTLADGIIEPGRHEVSWDGRNDAGVPVGCGVYFCTLEAGALRDCRKVALVR